MTPLARHIAAVAGLIAVASIWGLTFIFVKWTVASVDVYWFLFLRFVLASLLMAAFFSRHLLNIDRQTLRAGVILGVLLAAAFIAQTEGLRFTTATNSSLITCLYMVLVPVGMYVLLGRQVPPLAIAGIALAFPGSILLTSSGVAGANRGDLITAIVPITAALHIILTGEYAKRHALIPLVAIQFVCIALASGGVAAARGALFTPLPPIGWFTVVFNAVFASCAAFTIQTAAQRVIDPTRAGIIFSLEAVFGTLFGWWLGGEMLTAAAFAGACLMVSGMVISEIRPLTKGLLEKMVS